VQRHFAARHLHPHRGLLSQPAFVHVSHETTGAVAAVLHLPTVGVVNDVFEIHPWMRGWSHREDLVGTDAKMAVGQETVLGRR